MKKHLNVALLMIAMILGLSAVSPVLSQEQSRGVTIGRDTKVGGKALEKGSYTLKFVEGKEGELVFLHGKREVVKASYETTKLTTPATETGSTCTGPSVPRCSITASKIGRSRQTAE